MSVPEGIVQTQTEALLRRVASERDALAGRVREAAREQGRALVAQARAEGRVRVRQAAREARQSLERALADRRAALDTAARRHEQSLLRGLLDAAWQALPGELAAVWDDAAARRAWCEAAGSLAGATLLGDGDFTVEIDASLGSDAAEHAVRALQAWNARAAVRRNVGLGPGLLIRRPPACVDATVAGLLAARERVEAELLAELEGLLEERRESRS